ncbi:LOW QUALITY PROTEIN: hypothetical protein MAR_001977, partial [Mya arenaria]
ACDPPNNLFPCEKPLTMSGEEEEVGEMTLAVRQLTETLEDLLQYGRDSVQESKEEFINGKIGKLFGMSFAYEKCYNRLHVSTKEGLERKIHRFSRDRDLREASSDLLDVEQDWDTFLQGVDKSLEGKTEDTVQVGETGPLNFPLVDARSGEATSLQEYVGKGTSPMGGDFILDQEGNAAFLYPSKTNTDRPSVDMIVTELQKIQSSQK